MSKLFELNGHSVFKEYYINDAGRQVELLTDSVLVRIRQLRGEKVDLDDEHYHGEYLKDIAREIIENKVIDFSNINNSYTREEIKRYVLNKIVSWQKETLKKFNVEFNNWFQESSLHNQEIINSTLNMLEEKHLVYTKEGKIFFKSTEFGDEKDRVIIRDDKRPTYFFMDIIYHLNKVKREFTKIIDLWGPDHDGYIPRMKGAMNALGLSEEDFRIVIIQQVNLVEKSKKIQMSKRLGSFVLMDDLINEIGVDVARFFFLNRSISSHLDFDMDLAKKQSDENPVYYVQYAYARICNIFKQAEKKNFKVLYKLFNDNWEITEYEVKLMKKLLEYPVIIKDACYRFQPNLIPTYLIDLSTIFHQFYTECRVIDEDNFETSQNRLFLSECTRIVLKNALDLIGVKAPERM